MTDENLIIERGIHKGGTQRLYRFDNNLGASVVRHNFSYGNEQGNWELAVIEFHGEADDDWTITYDTPITNDVLGNLTEAEVNETLEQIKSLSKD